MNPNLLALLSSWALAIVCTVSESGTVSFLRSKRGKIPTDVSCVPLRFNLNRRTTKVSQIYESAYFKFPILTLQCNLYITLIKAWLDRHRQKAPMRDIQTCKPTPLITTTDVLR
jgi:hypothetical protein